MRTADPEVIGMSPDVSRRIEILRVLLICGVVILHTPPTWYLDSLPPEAHGWPGVIKLFLDYGPFRAGVPTLSLISGYLLFLRPYGAYGELLRRKLPTLIVPFLVWNALTIGAHALRGQDDLGLSGGAWGWLARIGELLDNPPDYPTYFLPDLFACAALAPIIGVLMRRLPLPILLVGSVAAALGYGPIPMVRPDVALPFAAGAAIALHRVDPCILDRHWLPIGIAFLVFCTASIAALAGGYPSLFQLGLLRALGVPAAWTVSVALAGTRTGQWLAGWSRYAFLLFCAHSPLLHLIAGAWPAGLDYGLFYATVVPTVIAGVLGAGRILEERSGLAWHLLTGSRRPATAFRVSEVRP
jgi:succinoglycan biosynthesis protein ExoH